MKKFILILIISIFIISLGACAKNPSNNQEDSSNSVLEDHTEEKKILYYEKFILETNEGFKESVSNANELAKSPSLSPTWIVKVKKELDDVIKKADDFLAYGDEEIPEKYKEVHEDYKNSVEKIKELADEAPNVALSMDEKKIKELSKEFEEAYNIFLEASKDYEALKNE